MTKFKILAVVVLICILGQSAVLVYFVSKARGLYQKNQELTDKIKSSEPWYQEYTSTAKELETIKADRENILVQTKGLLGAREEARELKDALEKATTEASAAEKELGQVKGQDLSLTEERNKLQAELDRLTQERDRLKIDYGRSTNLARIKDLKEKLANLQRDLKGGIAEGRAQERDNFLARLTEEKNKWEAARDRLTGELRDYKKNYAIALNKNRGLDSKIRETPSKFAEIARQNKVLLRQTSEMHYNLGVFYSKGKDYDRAVAEFEQCVAINPNDASAHFNLGYIYSEYLVNRDKAMDHFRHYLRLAKSSDPDVDWVKKYILTWETYSGRMPMQ